MTDWVAILVIGGLSFCAAGAAFVTGDPFFAGGALCFSVANVALARRRH